MELKILLLLVIVLICLIPNFYILFQTDTIIEENGRNGLNM